MTTYIKIPFAQSGDKTNPPDTDAAGGVNWTQGYPNAYSRDPATSPTAKRIEREFFNGVLNQLSTAINEIQVGGLSPWISPSDNGGAAVQYPSGAAVSYQGKIWISLIDNNTGTPSIVGNWMVPGPSIGDVIFRFKNAIPVIPGAVFMLANGSTIAPSSYPHYARTVDATGKIPEYRGQFLRVLDNGAGIDPGRVTDSGQQEQVNFSSLKYYGPAGGSGNNVNTIAVTNSGQVGNYTSGISQGGGGATLAFSPTTGETRPANVAIAAYIRIG